MPILLRCLACLLLATSPTVAPEGPPPSPRPSIAYTLTVDTTQIDVVHVALRLENVPTSFRLAMKVHAEYDAQYWRYLDSLRIEGSANDGRARVTREDSTLWSIAMPGGRGTLRYRIRVQQQTGEVRDAWRPFARRTGALINPPDFFLYLPDFAAAPATVELEVPTDWRIATSLPRDGTRPRLTAPDAATLLDSPILLGHLREWSFADAGTRFHVFYWPLPEAAPFDAAAFVDGVRRLAHVTLTVFGRAPSPEYYFLFQDGAQDALEHGASVTIGLPSERLARDPHAYRTSIAHEFFHTWNLVAIRPDRYLELSYRKAEPTSGLWWGEGVTLYYADALPRRAGIADSTRSRLDHLSDVLRSYYSAWWSTRVSPERASLAFGASPVVNTDATGGYYTQGELLGDEIDALIRDSTQDARGLDDVMRAMFVGSSRNGGRGFSAAQLEAVTDSICRCRLDVLFRTQVRESSLIDVRPVLARIGLRLVVDTIQMLNDAGAPAPDLRIGFDFTRPAPPLRIVVANPASAWRRGGLRTGDELTSLDQVSIATFDELRHVLGGLHVGQTVAVDIRRDGDPMRLAIPVTGYTTARVRFVDVDGVSALQTARRAKWLAGW